MDPIAKKMFTCKLAMFYPSKKERKKHKEKVDVFPYCLLNKNTIKTAVWTLDALTLWLTTLAELVGGDEQSPPLAVSTACGTLLKLNTLNT